MWFILKAGKVLRVSEAAERALLTEFDDEQPMKPIIITVSIQRLLRLSALFCRPIEYEGFVLTLFPFQGNPTHNDGQPVANVIAFDESSSEQKAKTPKAPTTLMVPDSSDESSEVSKDDDSDSGSGSDDSS